MMRPTCRFSLCDQRTRGSGGAGGRIQLRTSLLPHLDTSKLA